MTPNLIILAKVHNLDLNREQTLLLTQSKSLIILGNLSHQKKTLEEGCKKLKITAFYIIVY